MAKEQKPVVVQVRSANNQSLEHAKLYVFNKAGHLIETAGLEKGRVQLRTGADEIEDKAEMWIAPVLPDDIGNRLVTPSLLRKAGGYQPALRLLNNEIIFHGVPAFSLLPFKWCLVTGRLTKTFSIDGTNKVLPVCDARVHVCEVDRIHWWWWRIPPRIIADLGRKLKEIILYPERIPIPIPEPDPAPFSHLPNAGSFRSPLLSSTSLRTKTSAKVSLKKQVSAPSEIQSASSAGLQAMAISATQMPSALPDGVKSGLLSSSALIVSETIRNNFHLLHPYICWWPWFWPYFYVYEEIGTVYSDCNGRFNFEYLNLTNDKDIYVWVEVCLPNGQWVTVYRPPVPCNTRWNYTCGTDINITITDPRVLPCTCTGQAQGEIVWFRSIGEAATALHIEQSNGSTASVQGVSLPNVGCTDIINSLRISPFGSDLYFKLLFGDGFPSATITHYRWRRTQLKDAALNDILSPPTNAINSVVHKTYFVITQDSGGHYHFETRSVPLGPEGSGENIGYRIPHWNIYDDPGVPAADKALTIQWTSPDFWSAGIDSRSLADGLWRFELELLRKDAAGNFNVVEVPKQVFQVTDYFDVGESVDAPNTYLQINPVSPANAFRLRVKVRIDNAVCNADIQDASILVSGSPQYSGACGFLRYTDANQLVRLSFEATHPRHFATFGFGVVKGNNTTAITPGVNASGYVISGVGNYTLSGGIFSDEVPVSQLIGTCPQAAFSENLQVYALATNGTHRLDAYDDGDINAFALSNT